MSSETLAKESGPNTWPWGTEDSAPRVLHAMLRVSDVERSLHFYRDLLGMKILERYDFGDHTSMYLGFSDFTGAAVEIEHHAGDTGPRTHGSGFGHISLGFPDVVGLVARLESAGTTITCPPAQYFPDGPYICLIEDPDGYTIELVQTRRG